MDTARPFLTAEQFLRTEIRPALLGMQQRFRGAAAECMLAAIPHQETNYASLYQIGDDGQPIEELARGFYQFELAGVSGTMNHPANDWLLPLLAKNGFVDPTPESIHWALPGSSALQIWLARSNLWWNSEPLVEPIADAAHEEAAWQYYLFCWNPGQPHRSSWGPAWTNAVKAVEAVRAIR